MIIPFLSGCVSDDCSDCVDMAYDTRVKLKIIWPSNLSTTKSAESPELDIHDFTLFVFNEDNTLNTIKKVNNPTFSTTIPYSSSVTMNVTSTAKTIYVIANCSDLLSNSPTSSIATLPKELTIYIKPTTNIFPKFLLRKKVFLLRINFFLSNLRKNLLSIISNTQRIIFNYSIAGYKFVF